MERPGRRLLRLFGVAAFLILVLVFVSFLLVKLGAAPPSVLLGGPSQLPEDQAQLAAAYGLDSPAVVQFVRYVIRVAGLEFGRSWLTGEAVWPELMARVPATLELMIYSLFLGSLIGVPLGVAAAFARGTTDDRAVRGGAILGEAMPPFLLALVLLLVFFRWLDLSPAPSGRISVVLTPPPVVTGSMFIDAVLMQDSVAARSALGQLILPVATLSLLVAASMTLLVRGAVLVQLQAAHMAYARAQGMSREMLTTIALRGAAPAIMAGMAAQTAALLGGTALVEFVFSWGGVGHYGLEAMARADFAAVQGFIVLSGLFALLIHGVHALGRQLARLRIRRT
jgi:ABC-type dipeptide/oligopeptide/nickel transport system permease component